MLQVQEVNPLRVGLTGTSFVSFARPADTNAYAAGDVVSTSTTAAQCAALRFVGVARRVGGGGVIQSAMLIDEAAPATKIDSQLWLFTAPPAMQADNAAWAPTNVEMRNLVGMIAFATANFKVAQASTNGIVLASPAIAFNCDPNGQDLFGILVAQNAYTPVSAERFTIKLQTLQD